MAHPLHKAIGDIFSGGLLPGYETLKDPACGGEQNIPLFISDKNLSKNGYCSVDLLIHKDNKIKVIIEIEETNVKPTQICGKFLASALSSFYVHENKKKKIFRMDNKVVLIQILDTSLLKKNSRKIEQWKNIEKSINHIIPVKNNGIKEYKHFYGNVSEYNTEKKADELINFIHKFLNL